LLSHWSGTLVTYRALETLYQSGSYRPNDFYLLNYDPLLYGGPSMINDRQLKLFYKVTKGSTIFNKQTNVLILLSQEESNLIVDHHYCLNYANPKEQYFIA
jgi:hypothetical protein